MSTPAPALPTIEDINLILGVCTHKELRQASDIEPWDNERLSDLGSSVLNNVVTFHFFSKRPLVRAEEMRTLREYYTSPTMLTGWLESYHLKEKLRVPPNKRDEIYNDPKEMAAYFHSYLAAVYLTKGLPPVQAWITGLIDPAAPPVTLPGPNATNNNASGQASTSRSGPTSSSSSTSPLIIPVSLVNEVAMQRGCHLSYVASQEGQSHQPTWTVRCLVNNVEKGVGVGKNQKAAKEDAAQQAWVAMGW